MKLHVSLGEHGYDVLLLRGGLLQLGDFIDLNRKVLLVTDDGVPERWVSAVQKQLPAGTLLTVMQGESAKSFPVFQKVCTTLLENGFSRKDLVIALGGGVVGDLAGFAAASYLRGIDFVNLPTTSLSQIDSSIGGKTAINLENVKNIVGAFYQPKFVLIDSNTLSTLPARHVANGLVEAVKAGLIGDPELFSLFEQDDPIQKIDEIILRALQVKKRVVEADEKEQGLRRVLNFGHTIGHAVESVYGLSGLLHGEAVAVGMLPMIENESLKERTRGVFRRLSIDPEPPYDPDEVYKVLCRDKKAHGDRITIVKVRQCGKAEQIDVPLTDLKGYLKGGAAR